MPSLRRRNLAERALGKLHALRNRAAMNLSDPTGHKREITRLNLALAAAKAKQARLTADYIASNLHLNTDALTGANSRRAFDRFLQNVGSRVDEEGYTGKGCIVAIDLDRFKLVNDTYGHHSGDAILIEVVNRLKDINLLLADSSLYRFGGDEFILVILDKRRDQGCVIEAAEGFVERRRMAFEDYARQAVGDAITAASSEAVSVEISEGRRVDINFGISHGIGHFDAIDSQSIGSAIIEADAQAYRHKSGLLDFLEAYKNLNEDDRASVDRFLGFRQDLEVKGGFEIDRDISFSSLVQMEEFRNIISGLNDRALRWLFPDFEASLGSACSKATDPLTLGR